MPKNCAMPLMLSSRNTCQLISTTNMVKAHLTRPGIFWYQPLSRTQRSSTIMTPLMMPHRI